MDEFEDQSNSSRNSAAPNASAASPYELTAGEAAESAAGGSVLPRVAGGGGTLTHPPPQHRHAHIEHDQRKRKNHHFVIDGSGYLSSDVGCDAMLQQAPAQLPPRPEQRSTSVSRKRKSSIGTNSAYDDDFGEDSQSTRSLPVDKKQNHSEIEKRRRDKMNTYITELSAIVPMCGAMARKLDKLTVLRMSVQHMRSVRGSLTACPLTQRPRPAFLSEREVNSLILDAAHDSFLLVVGCDRGRLLYVSASVELMLHYDQSELLGQSLFDLLHPKDVAKVKEQLSSSDLSPRERLIDAKTMLPVKTDMVTAASRFCPGARRSFFCRIKCRAPGSGESAGSGVKEEVEPGAKLRKKQTSNRKYAVVQCTGYLKSWAPAEMSEGGRADMEVSDEGDASSMSCLVAVGRALPDLELTTLPLAPTQPLQRRPLQFVARHATDGKFLFVDQRVTLALGFLPQELVGTSLYEHLSGPGVGTVARAHKAALLRRTPFLTPPYTFRRKDGGKATITTHFKPFRNPWTKDMECLVANNTLVCEGDTSSPQNLDDQSTVELFKHGAPDLDLCEASKDEWSEQATHVCLFSEPDLDMQRLIDSQVESHKIGSAIAEEVLRRSSPVFSPELPIDLLNDVVFNEQQPSLVDSILCGDIPTYNNQVRNNVALNSAGSERSPPVSGTGDVSAGGLHTNSSPSVSPPLIPLGLDGNGEATMAVIMSLLEADAGLGGPVNFSGLPWPLP